MKIYFKNQYIENKVRVEKRSKRKQATFEKEDDMTPKLHTQLEAATKIIFQLKKDAAVVVI